MVDNSIETKLKYVNENINSLIETKERFSNNHKEDLRLLKATLGCMRDDSIMYELTKRSILELEEYHDKQMIMYEIKMNELVVWQCLYSYQLDSVFYKDIPYLTMMMVPDDESKSVYIFHSINDLEHFLESKNVDFRGYSLVIR